MSELAHLFEYETFASDSDEYDFIVHIRLSQDPKHKGVYRVFVEYDCGAIERFWINPETFDEMKKHWSLEESDETIMLLDTEF